MPRAICSDCGSKLTQGRCPTCGVVERAARPARPIRATDPDDEPPPPSRGMGPVWVVAAGLGGLLLGTAIIGGAVLLRDERRGSSPPNAVPVAAKPEPAPPQPQAPPKAAAGVNPAARPPIQWTPFRNPDGSFAADFPNGEPTKKPVAGADALGTGSGRWERADAGRTYSITRLAVDGLFADAGLTDDLLGTFAGTVGGEAYTVSGVAGTLTVSRTTAVWTGKLSKTSAIIVAVEDPSGLNPDDEAVKRFFTGLRIPAGK